MSMNALRPGNEAKTQIATARALAKTLVQLGETIERRVHAVASAINAMQDEAIEDDLQAISTESLRGVVPAGTRLGLIGARYPTLGALRKATPGTLSAINGIGPQSAKAVTGAVREIEDSLRAHTNVGLSIDRRTRASDALVVAAVRLLSIKPLVDVFAQKYVSVGPALTGLVDLAGPMDSRMKFFFRSKDTKDKASAALARISAILATEAPPNSYVDELREGLSYPEPDAGAAWVEFQANPIAVNTLLEELGALVSDLSATQGYLTEEIAKVVNNFVLDTSLLKATLRGYQAFGAKFALVQRRTILGDDMGLGKTIEALAVACHLAAKGHDHFLVVAPASVLVNWILETQKHTELVAYRLHGEVLEDELSVWLEEGGLGVTTYEALQRFEIPEELELSLFVVDEAHYVKNPEALRTKTVTRVGGRSNRVLYMTGTPMENRVDEFVRLIAQLQPELLKNLDMSGMLAGPQAFRTNVSPVYLRRNQVDVLGELPERSDIDLWLEFTPQDSVAYTAAVNSGNFMAMRQAAYATADPSNSAKLARLVELVEEAVEDGRKVIVFSFFRSVLSAVSAALGDLVVGQISGDVSPSMRQALVDDFTNREEPAVLVSQIIAGGVGLNIQAASVVILTEPQIKPTMEVQAIARSHRMGQTRTVLVYRLLAENSVDQRMLDMLKVKSDLFAKYAAASSLKEASAAALDPSSADTAPTSLPLPGVSETEEEIVISAAMESEIIRIERERLGLDIGALPEGDLNR